MKWRPIDYEAEYNNRARVPEHPEIFARWTREAEDYRGEAMQERRAGELGLNYGSTPRQFIDLFSPRTDGHTAARAVHPRRLLALARSVAVQPHGARAQRARRHGRVVGYDLCPQVTIADIIEEIRHACLFLWRRTGQRLMVYGHSAGGHLAAAMVATDWHELYPKTPADLVPAAYSISGVFDLTPLVEITMNAGLAARRGERARGLAAVLAGRRRAAPSTPWWAGWNRASSCARAGSSRETWGKEGAATAIEAIPGTNHFTVDRHAGRSGQRDGEAARRAGEGVVREPRAQELSDARGQGAQRRTFIEDRPRSPTLRR